MSEFVKKTVMGYREVPGGHSDPECTHVILQEQEYDKLLQKISDAEQLVRSVRYESEREISATKQNAAQKVHQAAQEAQNKVEAIREELEEERAENAHQRALNANLLRIAKERANAKRKLKPKKEHTGYGVVITGEKSIRYKDEYRKWQEASLWETVIQSPYTTDMSEEVVRKQISDDLTCKGEAGISLLNRLGIEGYYPSDYADMIEDKQWCSEPNLYNIALELHFQMNGRYGYWEVRFLHTKALQIIPTDLRLR